MEKTPLSDEKLLEQIAAGDTDALGQLASRYESMVLSLAYRHTQQWADAEDIAQEAFIRVFTSAARYKGQSGFKTWLYRIVINLCMDHHRKKKPAASLEAVTADFISQSEPDCLEVSETAEIIRKAISQLPERQKIALILHRYEHLSHAEISDATGWSQSAVESLLVRAYGNLRKTLGKFLK